MARRKMKLLSLAWGLLVLVLAATWLSPPEVAAQMQQWMQEEQARQRFQHQQLLEFRQQEQMRQMIDRQQLMQLQQQEQMRQASHLQQLFRAQQEERIRQTHERQMSCTRR